MSEKYNIDNAKNDIENLQDQNKYDFQEIKRLDSLIKDYDKRVTQAINLNNLINKKIQDDYEKFKQSIIDDNLDIGNGGSSGSSESIRIVDNLNSTSTTSALSANQGRVIKSSLDDIDTRVDDIDTRVDDVNTRVDDVNTRIDNLNLGNGGSSESIRIVDNLTSTSTTSALSANQGRVIKSSLDTITTKVDATTTKVDTTTTKVDNIMKDFNDHITNHPSGGGGIITNSLEPSTNDIPKVYFAGDISGMSKDVEKKLTFSYKSNTKKINGFVKMKWQGDSSLSYSKKNFTIKMFKDEGCSTKDNHTFKNWEYETNKYVLKANTIDHSHARNIVSARLWNDIVKSRKDYNLLPTEYQSMPNGGAIDGFPIKVYINGAYQGLYTWNIPKEGWTYGMKSEKESYAVLCGEDYRSGCFRSTPYINEEGWSLEHPKTLQDSIKTSWNNAVNFVMNNSGNQFKNGLSTYFDVNSLIDYYIFAYFSCGLDSMAKNQIYTTYNGIKWYAHMYDMDSTWGLWWDGTKFVSSSYRCQEDYESGKNGSGNLLYINLAENFKEEIYERYFELRNSVLSIDNVIDKFERFIDLIPNDLYEEDTIIWVDSIPSASTNNIQQIRKFIVERATYVDSKIAEIKL